MKSYDVEDDSVIDSFMYSDTDPFIHDSLTDSELDPDEEPKLTPVVHIPWKPKVLRSHKWDTQDRYH